MHPYFPNYSVSVLLWDLVLKPIFRNTVTFPVHRLVVVTTFPVHVSQQSFSRYPPRFLLSTIKRTIVANFECSLPSYNSTDHVGFILPSRLAAHKRSQHLSFDIISKVRQHISRFFWIRNLNCRRPAPRRRPLLFHYLVLFTFTFLKL